jgi:hypothetical protein
VAELICFETVRDLLAATLKGMAYDPDFPHLFAFVVNLGGDNGPFLKDLRFFAAKMINPKAALIISLFRLARRCYWFMFLLVFHFPSGGKPNQNQ